MAQFLEQRDRSPHDPTRDASFAALPGLIVIDGGKGQLASGVAALDELIAEGVAVVSLAKRLEEVFVPGRKRPIVLPRDSAASSSSAIRSFGQRADDRRRTRLLRSRSTFCSASRLRQSPEDPDGIVPYQIGSTDQGPSASRPRLRERRGGPGGEGSHGNFTERNSKRYYDGQDPTGVGYQRCSR